jgi:hypothetical protein
MLNYELFNVLTKVSHITGQIQKTRRERTAPCYGFLNKGFAYEFYQTDKGRQLVSWFWSERQFVIPTSPYSTIIFSNDTEFLEFDYCPMFEILRKSEEERNNYYLERARHNLRIAERISDLRYMSPFKNYIKLKEYLPEVFDYANEETIASYLNITVSELRKFMLKRPDFLKASFTH